MSEMIPRKGGMLWRLEKRYVTGIKVYKGIDTAIYEPYMESFRFLGLKKRDVVRLLNLFLQVDKDNCGEVDMFEFLMAVDIDRSPFAAKIFAIFDADGSKKVDFFEFVVALWNFCSLSEPDLCAFAFRCFARRRGDRWELDDDDCGVLLDAIYGAETTSKERRLTTQYLEHTIRKTGAFTYEQWQEWTKHNARALFPIFNIQRRMRKRCLGSRFWRRQQRRRKHLFGHMTWEAIERRLEMADMERKRRVIHFDQRKPLPFDDDDLLDPTPRSSRENVPDAAHSAAGCCDQHAANSVVVPPSSSSFKRDDDDDDDDRRRRPAATRTKKKRRSSRVVDVHGFQQLVADPAEEEEDKSLPPPPASERMLSPTDPVEVKVKRFVRAKRTRAEAVAILNGLRKPSRLPQPGGGGNIIIRPAPSSSNEIINHVVADSSAAARFIAKAIETTKPADRLKPEVYRVLCSPSQLEQACGITDFGQLSPIERPEKN
ncbi:hypothetical protein CTAYLR_007600 [Chrysophaeum taylorii]|uniref:EF-hand domain-containing protein n=1 Tax=Chrysophaeum taylorii TaxID=2483200 RepID=A0AAD7XK29_9STRA|nr:hypothetical protein CTAYLR_007600 [Chrysophaeum taylorii]